jgi:hypothetical protein
MVSIKLKYIFLAFIVTLVSKQASTQTLSETQMRNARATGYAIVAARNPGKSFSILMIPWDGVNTLEYNANTQINSGWHAQAVIKGNYFYQSFDNTDFSVYSSVLVSQSEFDQFKNTGTQWWIVCSTLPPFSNTGPIVSDNGNIGIGTLNPSSKLDIKFQAPFNTSIPGPTPYGLFLSGQSTRDYATGITFSAADAAPSSAQSGIYSQGSGSYGTKLYFATTDSYESGAKTSMMIDASGNVGIGSLTPFSKLDLKFQAPFNTSTPGLTPYGLFLSGQSTPDYATGITFSAGDASPGTAQSGIYSQGSGSYGTKLYFATTDSYTYGAKNRMMIDAVGNVGIGTTSPNEKLTVNGNIRAKKLTISQTGWPDYVFDSKYKLKSIFEVEQYIKKYKHLPDVPSANNVDQNGINVGDNQAILLKKIEELTLYVIELEKRIKKVESINK